jgi:hypothetical protein
MVVVGIIVLLVSVTLPAVGPMMASSKEAQVFNTLGSLLVNAQATTSQTGTCVALRVERAFKADDRGFMLDAAGRSRLLGPAPYDTTHPVVWLDHQQVRFVTLGSDNQQVLSQLKDTKVYDLPNTVWIAPDYSLATGWPTSLGLPNWAALTATAGNFAESNVQCTPLYNSVPYATFNRLETFYIVFNPSGNLVQYPAGNIVYADASQQYLDGNNLPISPRIAHPDSSARSVFIYDRNAWNELAPTDSAGRAQLLARSRSVNINRVTGCVVEEKAP